MITVEHKELEGVVGRITARIQQQSTGQPSRIISDVPGLPATELEKRGIMKRYQGITFEAIEQRGIPLQARRQYQAVKEYADVMAENIDKGRGLILMGPVGTMKKSLIVAVLRQYLESGGSGLFVPMVRMLDNLFTMKERNREEWIKYEDKLRTTGLLVLDDLGAEYHQDWVLSKVDAIIANAITG